MDTFGERTLCLLYPVISSITASTFLPGSTSRGSRSRTRMGTSMERNFYTFILFSLALVILILSPSASANPINVTIDANTGQDPSGITIYRKSVARERGVSIACTAHVPNAQMTWYRIKDDKQREDMTTVCVGKDVELIGRMKRPPVHCAVIPEGGTDKSTIKLKIYRARKEGNETLKTIPDFRKYVCKAVKEGNQDGQATIELLETVKAERHFEKGLRSVLVVEGDALEIYCDIQGVDKKEFETQEAKLAWSKDGKPLQVDELKKIRRHGPEDKGRPYQVGFVYDMAEPEHRGWYTGELTRAFTETDNVNSTEKVNCHFYVRVKDKLGALWPFLGICGEVVILCTIILIYENRRNKTELDESDTDGSPDQ